MSELSYGHQSILICTEIDNSNASSDIDEFKLIKIEGHRRNTYLGAY